MIAGRAGPRSFSTLRFGTCAIFFTVSSSVTDLGGSTCSAKPGIRRVGDSTKRVVLTWQPEVKGLYGPGQGEDAIMYTKDLSEYG